MKHNKLAEDFVKFQSAWLAGTVIGHSIAYVLCKVVVYGLWLYFIYWSLQTCTRG